ncbi:MAG TPA: replication-associated recombination protein A [Candidatus Paceibacterota bacterium]|nr:replication-associated recombination protein A [Candidatus Paceibacterota bacterium]
MEPLAARMRPETLKDVAGQEHLIGEGKPLQVAIEKKHRFSFILWGPPGSGKTTLARIYARALNAELYELSAVSAGKDDIRKIVANTQPGLLDRPRVLFLDEIHRFNKSQQDFLLPYVESGVLTLIGATTENPSFEVIPALLSRARVFVLEPHSEESLTKVIKRTKIKVGKDAFAWLMGYANGDARKLLTILEGTQKLYGAVTVENLNKALESPHLRYDKKGDEHYDTVSAFIKSMRASQPDASMYYLARMVEAGEDPLFIARRMVIFASEDIGLAQPTALVVANAVFRACETIGYPECAINLAHGAAYLANAPKTKSAYEALREAQADIARYGNLPIPKKIRNAPTKLMQELEYGKGYERYDEESYMPEKLKKKRYFPKKD